MSEEGNILAVLPRSATEQIQVATKEYKGKKYLDLRIFYTMDSGASWLPSKKGITVAPENLEMLKDSIEQAISEFAGEE